MNRSKYGGDQQESEFKVQSQKNLKSANDPVEKLRHFCLTRGVNGVLKAGRLFRRLDNDGSRTLSPEEFRKGLKEIGFEEETELLFRKLDKDNSGSINIDEFLNALRPPMSEPRIKVLMDVFTKLDKNKDGVLTIDDIKGLYNVKRHPKYLNGEWTEEEILHKFLSNFESSGIQDGMVTKEEFLDYYSGMSASIDNDSYFDLMVRNAWKL